MTDEIERGRLAREVLENPEFIRTMAQIHEEVLSKWQSETDPKQREWLWLMSQARKQFQEVLTQSIADGEFTSRQIEMRRSKLERLGRTLAGR